MCDYKVVNSFEGQPYFVDTIDGLKPFQQKIDPNNTEYSALAQVIREIEDHKWVKDLYSNAPIVTNTITPTTGNKTPEKNETTFWSEHKGKISLGVGGLCAVGAIAAYVLAYPAVALALTVLAAVILMGTGIAKVLENSNVEKPFTQQQEVH
ncbi:hypothetical protein [Wolbachia endosymbiont (group A) of Icerya purchasi]|uniref:hypothetical protein n=1 Tax=Wolbachia endosymbiont (group A) of Icerya purchasi TaxID=2954019 RepID=UPI00222E42EC|nr:hypothetical protein [Wolbachia endosymbiont (group A) of Icerya purchasi]